MLLKRINIGNRIKLIISALITVALIVGVPYYFAHGKIDHSASEAVDALAKTEYKGEIAIEINGNKPVFSDEELDDAAAGFERYSKLDSLGRCGTAEASICAETMPAPGENRTSMGSIYPTGWQRINFWCRCHLIGWQLAAENANERNLITGTSRMNLSGMLPYENKIAGYIEENPDSHVLYRVEPVFDGRNLVANGVIMQAESVEDKGASLSFNVYVFNYQPGYIINYKDGTIDDDPDHQTTITIEDKNEAYTGEPITISPAKVEGSTGDIRYIYYIDEDAKERTTVADGALAKGEAPSHKGTYRVRAVVSGDNWYPTAASNVAELVIY